MISAPSVADEINVVKSGEKFETARSTAVMVPVVTLIVTVPDKLRPPGQERPLKHVEKNPDRSKTLKVSADAGIGNNPAPISAAPTNSDLYDIEAIGTP